MVKVFKCTSFLSASFSFPIFFHQLLDFFFIIYQSTLLDFFVKHLCCVEDTMPDPGETES